MDDPTVTITLPAEKFEADERARFQRAVQAACDFRQDNPSASSLEIEIAGLRALTAEGFGADWMLRLTRSAETAFGRLRAINSHEAGNA